MVTEYFPHYLDVILMGASSSDSSNEAVHPVSLVELSTRKIITMALHAARGLQALHEVDGGPIVHADLQPRQLLVDVNGVVKINDLNRCRFMSRDEHGNTCPFKIDKGNGAWRAPEEHLGEYGVSVKIAFWWAEFVYDDVDLLQLEIAWCGCRTFICRWTQMRYAGKSFWRD